MGKFDFIYEKLPLWAQNAAVSTYGLYWYWLRFGPGYRQQIKAYRKRQAFSESEWNTWQERRLRDVLAIAAKKVPYYKRMWTEAEKRQAMEGHVQSLPLLEKDAIRATPRDFVRQDKNTWPELTFHTSGSTGTPIATKWTVQELRESMALREVRSANWAGVSFRMPRATFSGRLVEPNPNSEGPFYRFNLVERQVYFSPFHLRSDTAHFYIDALHKHEIEWLTGYAVSYYLLARFMIENGLKLPQLKAVVTTSEKVTSQMRKTMEKAFGCPVYEEYSTVENVIFASECEHGRLHVSPDVSFVEILRPDGTPCAPGEVGKVVVTSLMRIYQPLVRFCLGDLAKWDPQSCPCGRCMPVIKEVVGRIEDVVVGPDGRQMVRFHGIFTDQPHVQEGQIIQTDLDHLCVRVVPSGGFDKRDINDIMRRVYRRLGPNVSVSVETVDHIPRTSSGKYKAVISQLSQDELERAKRQTNLGDSSDVS